ncbi:hypothetical protein O988_08251, partial [Pseudogymnoascus sp. VKM F-3808]
MRSSQRAGLSRAQRDPRCIGHSRPGSRGRSPSWTSRLGSTLEDSAPSGQSSASLLRWPRLELAYGTSSDVLSPLRLPSWTGLWFVACALAASSCQLRRSSAFSFAGLADDLAVITWHGSWAASF